MQTALRLVIATLARLTPAVLAAAILVGAPMAPASAEQAQPLVSIEWLKQHRGDPSMFVLDIRSAIDGGGATAYAQGHIPGAVHSDYDKAGWRVTRDNVPLVLPTLAQLEKLIGELGIDEDKHVVIVPAGVHYTDFGSAARVYWTLKIAGLKRISILDGGFAAWKADPANPVETKPNPPSPTIVTVAFNKALLAEVADVERVLQSGGATLLDARPASFFGGKQKAPTAAAYGHLPGALNVDSARFYDAAGNRLKPKAELEKLAAGIPSGPVVSYCNTGHWAATDWFVLHELLGRKSVSLYDGSMVEWTADARRKVESSRTKWDDLKKVLGLGS
ncbi:MAG: sulfurtransferase [Rhizobiales bacterium]|nr:sulfurtransferase [Hyphomicrobiales bacterium]